jgi:hypothetical protein
MGSWVSLCTSEHHGTQDTQPTYGSRQNTHQHLAIRQPEVIRGDEEASVEEGNRRCDGHQQTVQSP